MNNQAKNIAAAWFDCFYDEAQAKRSADIQDIDWQNVLNEYGQLYAEMEGYSCGS